MTDCTKLIEALRHCSTHALCDGCPREDYCTKNDDAINIGAEAADAIEELQAALPHWISVEDRLPNVGDSVLINCNFDGKHYRYMITSWTGIKNHGIADWENVGFALTVTHWMPMPEPPKEVGEDG